MSTPMRLMVTGAAGFIGSRVVEYALAAGHEVVAVVRQPVELPFAADQPGLSILLADLGRREAPCLLSTEMASVSAIIHAAAPLKGTDASMPSAGIEPLQTVFEAIRSTDGNRPALVHVSSMSVYGASALSAGAVIDEATPLEQALDQRDLYCCSKLAQEQLARDSASELGVPLILARPGFVYDNVRLWNAHLGLQAGGYILLLSGSGQVPIVHVESCAEMLVRLAEFVEQKRGAGSWCQAVNLLDSSLPTRPQYAAALVASGAVRGVVDLSWVPLDAFGRIIVRILPAGHIPGLFRPATYAFRLRPARYCNARIRALVGEITPRTFENIIGSQT